MSDTSQTQIVQQIYAAFGRGDVPAILEHLSPSVDWEYGAGSTGDVPWLLHRTGRAGAAAFFGAVGEHLQITHFAVKAIVESGRMVLGVLDLKGTVRGTGRPIVEEDEVHVWHFGDDGLVARFRHRADTAQHLTAWRG